MRAVMSAVRDDPALQQAARRFLAGRHAVARELIVEAMQLGPIAGRVDPELIWRAMVNPPTPQRHHR